MFDLFRTNRKPQTAHRLSYLILQVIVKMKIRVIVRQVVKNGPAVDGSAVHVVGLEATLQFN